MRNVMWNFENMIIRLQATDRIENFINMKGILDVFTSDLGWALSVSDAVYGRWRCLGSITDSLYFITKIHFTTASDVHRMPIKRLLM